MIAGTCTAAGIATAAAGKFQILRPNAAGAETPTPGIQPGNSTVPG